MQPTDRSDAWGVCHELAVLVYRITAGWPRVERYGLARQLRHAAFSAASHAADDPPAPAAERLERLKQAVSALVYLRYALVLARELDRLSAADWASVDRLRSRAEGLLRAIMASLPGPPQALRSPPSWYGAFRRVGKRGQPY